MRNGSPAHWLPFELDETPSLYVEKLLESHITYIYVPFQLKDMN